MKSVVYGGNPVAMSIKAGEQGAKQHTEDDDDDVWNFNSSSTSYSDSDSDDSDASSELTDAVTGVMPRISSRGIVLPQHLHPNGAPMGALNHHSQTPVAAAAILELARRRSQAELAAATASLPRQVSQAELIAAASAMPRRVGLSRPELAALVAAMPHSATPLVDLNSANKGLVGARNYQSTMALAALKQHIQSRQANAAAMLAVARQQRMQQAAHAANVTMAQNHALPPQYEQPNGKKYRRVESECGMQSLSQPKKKFKRSESEFFARRGSNSSKEQKSSPEKKEKKKPVKPEDHLRALLKAKDLDLDKFSVDKETFLPNTKAQTEDYPEAAQAARDENLEVLERLHTQGKNLQSANVYGESIIHIVCRRGNYDMYEFLSEKAKVSIRVRDDIGRTPLHDAAWTDKPNFELVEKIIRQEPDLLFARDNRRSSPLAYVPPNRWPLW
eukprot:CAMPEP_0117059692 /NCGR_PEP_ID=MMETSP0472-20121206/41488_1 /TAXON_ID=693140 ORGANISM="Tiarina fusus, Strain LIS" /NCGR_SAMPLE_ID=MMETSP0472 /ASSEMBLY_ACC=CAM_ASM_000603 /LENGTH=445 /DNA_ID=CAMNT_0004777547 /DNA_START=63 /DNA_END=1397 /DNA_ORIENTATION=+